MSSDLNLQDEPTNPPADYAEVENTFGVRKAQSSAADEQEAGQKVNY